MTAYITVNGWTGWAVMVLVLCAGMMLGRMSR